MKDGLRRRHHDKGRAGCAGGWMYKLGIVFIGA
nr:MAG TPA: hypothetical protein [Caudoviricetes sp.]